MKPIITFLLLFLLCFAASGQKRIVVDRSNLKTPDSTGTPMEYYPRSDSSGPRLVLDPADLVYQMRVDSINKETEEKIKSYIVKLERKFEDPKVEDEIGKLIGDAVMEQQMALLNLQIDRAVSLRDTLLLKGLELALQEVINNREEIQKQIKALQKELEGK
jgi:hypothetical protein